MSKTKRKNERVRIRKGSLKEDVYVNRKGQWVEWKDAAVFTSQTAAERFAERHGITNYGLF